MIVLTGLNESVLGEFFANERLAFSEDNPPFIALKILLIEHKNTPITLSFSEEDFDFESLKEDLDFESLKMGFKSFLTFVRENK